jgi:hypothetical protein
MNKAFIEALQATRQRGNVEQVTPPPTAGNLAKPTKKPTVGDLAKPVVNLPTITEEKGVRKYTAEQKAQAKARRAVVKEQREADALATKQAEEADKKASVAEVAQANAILKGSRSDANNSDAEREQDTGRGYTSSRF